MLWHRFGSRALGAVTSWDATLTHFSPPRSVSFILAIAARPNQVQIHEAHSSTFKSMSCAQLCLKKKKIISYRQAAAFPETKLLCFSLSEGELRVCCNTECLQQFSHSVSEDRFRFSSPESLLCLTAPRHQENHCYPDGHRSAARTLRQPAT